MRQSATPTDRPIVRRRTYRFLGLTLILLTLALALPAGASAFVSTGGSGWFTQTSWSDAWLYAVTFTDATHGWAVGSASWEPDSAGVILATTDGGATWGTQSAGRSGWLYAITFTDATHGWAVGDHGAILAHTDGLSLIHI